MSSHATPGAVPAPDNPGKRRRRWPWIVGGLALLLVLAVALAPSLLSSAAGRSIVAGAINKSIMGSVRMESLSLGWFGPQRIGKLELLDPEGGRVLVIDEVSTDLSLLSAIRGNLDLGVVLVRGLDADIIALENPRTTNLERAIAPTEPGPDEPARVPDSLRGIVRVEGAKARISGAGIDAPVQAELAGETKIAAGEPLGLNFAGTSRQGDLGGRFKLDGTIASLIAADGLVTPAAASPKLTLTTSDLPVAGIDGIVGMGGLLTEGIGPALNLTIVTEGTRQSLKVLLHVDAPRLKAELAGIINEGKSIALDRPAVADFTLTPRFVTALTSAQEGQAPMTLASPVDMKLRIERLDMDLGNWAAASIGATFAASEPLRFTGDTRIGPVTVSNLHASLDTRQLSDSATLLANADLVTDGRPGKFELKGNLEKLLDGAGKPRPDMVVDITATLNNVPVALPDRLGGQEGLLVDAVGESLDLVATARSTGQKTIDLTLNLTSANLTAKVQGDLAADFRHVTIADSNATFMATPRLMQRFAAEGAEPIAGPAAVALVIKRIEMPLGEGASLDALQLDVSAHITSESPQDPLARAIGQKVPLALKTQPVVNNVRPVHLTIGSDRLEGSVVAHIREQEQTLRLALAEPGKLRVTLSNDLLALIKQPPLLAESVPAALTIEKLNATISPFKLATVELVCAAAVNRLEMAGEGELKGTVLTDAQVALAFDGPKGTAKLNVDGKAAVPGRDAGGPIKVDAVVARLLDSEGELDTEAATADATIKLSELPTAFVDGLTGQNGRLTALAGPTMNVDATAKLTGLSAGLGTVDAKVSSTTLTADAGLKLADMIELTRPLKVRIDLTPRAYAELTAPKPPNGAVLATPAQEPPPRMTLTGNTRLDLTVQSLRWPRGGQKFEPARAMIDAVITASTLEFADPASKQRVAIRDFKASARAEDLSKPLRIAGSGEVDAGKSGTGKIQIEGAISDLYNAQGELNTDAMSIALDAVLQKFPVALADALMGQGGMLLAALGPTMDVTAKVQLQQMRGPLTMQIISTHAKAAVSAQISDDAITLNESVNAELGVSPELSKRIFARASPFMRGVTKEGPVTVVVGQEGFRLPRQDFAIEKVVIPHIALDLGQVTVENDFVMKGLMSLLKRESRDKMPAWFTPAIVKVEGGKLTFTRRMDILLDNAIHVATWGEADLTAAEGNESRYTQVLALMPAVLSNKPFGLENLGPNDVLRIPVRGTSARPEIDYRQAGTDVARLVAQSETAKANPLAGALLGRLLKDVLGGPPIPPPSSEELPWKKEQTPPAEQPEAVPQEQATEPQPKPRERSIEENLRDLFRR